MKQFLPRFLCLFILLGCDKGLSPPPQKPSISGQVRFLSPWPHKDSVGLLALALVSVPPPYTGAQLLGGLGKTVLPVISEFGYGLTDTAFYYEMDPGTYYYLGVARHVGADPLGGWSVVGFAHDEEDSAIIFDLSMGERAENILIDVRFDSLPRQPLTE